MSDEENLDPDIELVLDQLMHHWQAHDIQGKALGFCVGCSENWPCPGFEALGALSRISKRLYEREAS